MWACSLLMVLFMLAIAYLVFVTAKKEKGNIKKIGEVLAWSIVILSVLVYVGSMFACSGGKCGMMDKSGMMHKPGMMMRK